ncbi:MAG: class I SAM-dependent methyltransferase [Desulfobacteraceae bacterium]|nr:class I SAM-dependent methyltransferase [Desulfobacteraceae bacterium]
MTPIKRTVLNHFNSLADYYDEKCMNRRVFLSGIDNLILEHLRKRCSNGLKILDVGCGTGRRTEKYKLSLEKSVVYGCDISPIMINIARTRQIDKTILSDMSELQLKNESFNESFDVILCLFNSFGYLPDREQRLRALTKFRGILKNDGLLFIDVMNRWHIREGLNFKKSILSVVKTYVRSVFSPAMSSGDMYFSLSVNDKKVDGWVHGFSNSEIPLLLSRSGFSVKEKFCVGYDSGEIKKYFWQGQLFYICEKHGKIKKEYQ